MTSYSYTLPKFDFDTFVSEFSRYVVYSELSRRKYTIVDADPKAIWLDVGNVGYSNYYVRIWNMFDTYCEYTIFATPEDGSSKEVISNHKFMYRAKNRYINEEKRNG